MAQTVKQYIATLKRTAGCPDDLRTQVNAWPYPQANQSHLAIWRASWAPAEALYIPRHLSVPLDNSDSPGVLLRIRSGAPTPKEIVEALSRLESSARSTKTN